MEKSVFETWLTYVQPAKRSRRYPHYKVDDWKIGTASSLVGAEKMISEYLAKPDRRTIIHSFIIREVPIDRSCPVPSCLASFIYDQDGIRTDERAFSTIIGDNGVFTGRTPEQIRFKDGDIVEIRRGKDIELGFIAGVPMGVEEAKQFSSSGLILDDTDDQYTIMFNSDYASHTHVSALSVFRPRFNIPQAMEMRLRKEYNDYVTLPARLEIQNITAKEQLTEFFEKNGMKGTIYGTPYMDDDFCLALYVNGRKQEFTIDREKVYNHIDRVCCTLARFAGIPARGRGYRLQVQKDGELTF